EAPQLVPVVGDDDLFVGATHLALVPGGNRVMQVGRGQPLADVIGRPEGQHEAFQQRVAGHAVGAVQTGEAGLADGVEVGDVGAAVFVHHDTAAGVVGRGHHRNAIAGDVDAELQAAGVNGGEVL